MSGCQGLLLNRQPIPVPLTRHPQFFFHHTRTRQWRLSSFAKIGGVESIAGSAMELSAEFKDAPIPALRTPLQGKASVTVSAGLNDEKKKEESRLLRPTSVVIPYGNRQIKLETGLIGRQANGSITITDGETILYTSICMAEELSEPSDFVPLTVHYQERFSAAGRTSRAFYKREGRAKDREVLICRLIDRPLRPMIAKGLNYETQILSWVFSYDGVHSPEPLAITAAGAALALSDIPSAKVVAAVRVGMVNEELIVNPTVEQLENSKLDMILACTTDAIVMIEGYCDFLTEDELIQAVSLGQDAASRVCEGIEELVKKSGKLKKTEIIQLPPPIIYCYIEKLAGEGILNALQIETKKARQHALSALEEKVLALLTGSGDGNKQLFKAKEDTVEIDEAEQVIEDGEIDQGDLHLKPVVIKPLPELFDPTDVKLVFREVTSKFMRQLIVQNRKRSDGRSVTEIRKVQSLCGLLPRSHGSSLFTRGETQAIAVTTLGGHDMGQRLDNLMDTDIKRFYFQYTFPPSSVGETGRVGVTSRREIGHGMLAERALEPALPSSEEFPYTIRVESTITESNGSSSMASVCGGCLAMLDAGVPLKCFVGGVAMGLILNTREYGGDGEPLILSDITGAEDALGDMDLKISGSDFGVTAFQMDTKVAGIEQHVVRKALIQAKEARCCVLGEMRKCKPPPTRSLSKHAPLIEVMKVDPEKVNVLIGSAGKTVKSIIELSGADTVTIDGDGVVQIVAKSLESLQSAKSKILGLALEPTVGTIYRDCIVKSIVSFGCFIEIAPGREGLCHISELSTQRLPKVEDFVNVGDRLDVKLIEINSKGQLRLSHRAVLLEGQQKAQGKERSTIQVNDKIGLEGTDKELVGVSSCDESSHKVRGSSKISSL